VKVIQFIYKLGQFEVINKPYKDDVMQLQCDWERVRNWDKKRAHTCCISLGSSSQVLP
jgi:hypothetical protein